MFGWDQAEIGHRLAWVAAQRLQRAHHRASDHGQRRLDVRLQAVAPCLRSFDRVDAVLQDDEVDRVLEVQPGRLASQRRCVNVQAGRLS
jgi:hypothetical protein